MSEGEPAGKRPAESGAPAHDLALVISDLGSGGAQRVLTTMANAWAQLGVRVCVITLSGADGDFFKLDDNVSRIALDRKRDSSSLLAAVAANIGRIRLLRRALCRGQAPIVVSFVGATNVLTVLAAIGLGRHLVVCERNDPRRQSLGLIWDGLRRALYGRANLVTANSHGVMKVLADFVPDHKLAYLPNPLVRAPTPTQRGNGAECVLLSVGRLSRQKGYDVLLQAFAQISRDAPACRLIVAGDGDLRHELEGQARTLGLADRVEWAGRTADPYAYYAKADIFVLPSRYEGTPNALLEAMSFGLPCVVTNASPGPLEFVEADVTGLVVPTEDHEKLAAALASLIADGGLRKRLGAAAAARVSDLDLPQVLEHWQHVIGLSAPRDARGQV